MKNPAESVIQFYIICNRLKDTIRTGWGEWHVRRDRIESVAEHIYCTQMLAIAMASEYQYELDLRKVLFMLAIHELGEAVIGDFTPFQIDRAEKEKREHEAVHKVLSGLLNGDEIEKLFLEFDAHETPESRFAYQCDKLECDLQCRLYDEEGCVDLKKGCYEKAAKDPKVHDLLESGKSWSEMWLEYGQQTIPYDQHFLAVSDYALTHRIKAAVATKNDVMMVTPEIREYVETSVLPQYQQLKGHTEKHIEQVIDRSLKFSEQVPGVNIDMVYVIAAYHDLGRLVDNETHNIESAKMLRKDAFLRTHFSAEDIETMAEAVEDHRASLGREPRSVYGKIVSSADRNPNVESMLERCYDYTKLLNPDMTDDEVIEEARKHLREKYAPDGYAARTMYFRDEGFEKMLEDVERITRTPEGFAEVQKEYNRKRSADS